MNVQGHMAKIEQTVLDALAERAEVQQYIYPDDSRYYFARCAGHNWTSRNSDDYERALADAAEHNLRH